MMINMKSVHFSPRSGVTVPTIRSKENAPNLAGIRNPKHSSTYSAWQNGVSSRSKMIMAEAHSSAAALEVFKAIVPNTGYMIPKANCAVANTKRILVWSKA